MAEATTNFPRGLGTEGWVSWVQLAAPPGSPGRAWFELRPRPDLGLSDRRQLRNT
ncbi:MAG TPA: hypothetical protein VFI65_03555 [Streptosporangiaceae bacterium]|nr:hypothetical protein [Streptosporangiaceae bacterium]